MAFSSDFCYSGLSRGHRYAGAMEARSNRQIELGAGTYRDDVVEGRDDGLAKRSFHIAMPLVRVAEPARVCPSDDALVKAVHFV